MMRGHQFKKILGKSKPFESYFPKKINYNDRELRKLMKVTHFNFSEIKFLYKEFRARSGQRSRDEGGMSTVQLLGIFGISNSMSYYFAEQFINLFWIYRDKSYIVEIGFEEFVRVLSNWTRGDTTDKLTMIFQLYDKGQKGFISKADISTFLHSLAIYFLEIEYSSLDINSESFKSRTIIAHRSISEISECLEMTLDKISKEAIENFHEPDGEELLWCDEFKYWILSLPGMADIILPPN